MFADPLLAILEILRADSDLSALVHTNIHSRLANGFTVPAIEVADLGGSTVAPGIDQCLMQIDVWGLAPDKASLRTIADAARAALAGCDNTVTSAAVVTSVDVGPPAWLPEDEPDLSHYALTAVVTLHPTPA